jgi:hypothetical protein
MLDGRRLRSAANSRMMAQCYVLGRKAVGSWRLTVNRQGFSTIFITPFPPRATQDIQCQADDMMIGFTTHSSPLPPLYSPDATPEYRLTRAVTSVARLVESIMRGRPWGQRARTGGPSGME